MSPPARPSHPPKPRLCLSIGVTGHRDLEGVSLAHGRREAKRIFTILARAAAISDARGIITGHETAVLSQLAAGADQMFAEAALEAEIPLRVLLPFNLADYATSLPEEARPKLRHLAGLARGVWTAPAGEGDPERSYHVTGMVMLAQSDILIALWDGEPGRGPGGTAAVIDQAVRQGIPVIHVDPGGGPTRVLWSAFDHLGSERLELADAPSRPCDDEMLQKLREDLLQPPSDPDQRRALEAYLAEHERRLRPRLEYPLLLAVTGIHGLKRSHLFVAPYDEKTRTDWSPFHTHLTPLDIDSQGLLNDIQDAFSWSDQLADHYAQIYRGGTILNYVAAATAVLLALVGVLAPEIKPILLALELVSLAGLIANTVIGNRRQWHRRWLDYRYLAEQLRSMRSLKLVGAFGPRMGANAQAAATMPWTDWYAAAIWRGLGLPPNLRDELDVERVVAGVAAHELEPQIRYHESNSHRMHTLDERLHKAGTALFVISLAASLLGLLGYLASVPLVLESGEVLTVVGAALPTIGAALFGIRGQSDFMGAARRSEETARRLRRTRDRMRAKPMDLTLAARLMEDAAQTMAADLGEWRTTFLDRRLAIPS
jgi:hypothetical protein